MKRRQFVTSAVGSLFAVHCSTPSSPDARRTPPTRKNPPEDMKVFENFHRGLLQVHGELRDSTQEILRAIEDPASDNGQTALIIGGFCEELLNHHKSEDAFFFPAFRAAGKLKTSDVAFLEARDKEHHEVHRLCLALQALGPRLTRRELAAVEWRASIGDITRDLRALSLPHFEIEEITLTPPHVAAMITSQELVEVYRDMGENWSRK